MDGNSKKLLKVVIISFVILCIALSAGCTGTESSPSVSQTEVQATATVSQDTSKTTGSLEVIHNSKLKEFLPTATNNWESGEAIGLQTSDGESAWSWASKSYEQKMGGEAVVDIVIQDTAGEYVGYMASWDTYLVIDTPDMSMKQTTVQGFPGWIITDKENNVITQVINVKDRIIVYTSVTDGKEDYLTVFNNQMNLKGLSALV
ncbi:MAG: hypothetical protein PHV39_10370 [Methanomicrobium sp.]|nr:hypothetical protein [Methanomicrobium sp.]